MTTRGWTAFGFSLIFGGFMGAASHSVEWGCVGVLGSAAVFGGLSKCVELLREIREDLER